MGRTPIREALRRLAHEQLVEVYPRRGMFVAAVDVRDLTRHLGGARRARALRRAPRRRAPHRRRPRRARRPARRARRPGRRATSAPDRARPADPPPRLPRRAQRPSSRRSLEQHYMHALRIWFLALDRSAQLERRRREHRALLEAIRDGDADRARRSCPLTSRTSSRRSGDPCSHPPQHDDDRAPPRSTPKGRTTEPRHQAKRRRHRRRHRRQQPRRTTSPGSAGRDIVQIDKGPLPNPGGSTGHASNFIFPVDHSQGDDRSSRSSRMRQYKEMGVFTESGGIEVARTEERMEELRRRMSSAKSWGIEAELVTPARGQGAGAVPRRVRDPRRLLHADASASSTRCAPARSCASARWSSGALTVVAERRGHRHRRRATATSSACAPTRGDIEAETRRDRLRRVEPEDRARWPARTSR